ncbi:MAG: glutamate 5-kinase [Clostridiales bacterium]|nr:glutamate 5-kinase [Clostridiales bacterium]
MLWRGKRVVVKVGTSTLTYQTGRAKIREMEALVRVLSDMMNGGIQVALVTSGAIGVGMGKMGLTERPRDTPGKQAAATVGQCELMYLYDRMFSEYSHNVGQLLITKADVDDPGRRQNLIATFDRLFHWGVIPIINENDAVAVDEIVYGDNDSLSAIVAVLVHADALIILSDIDGLYDADPRHNPQAQLIGVVPCINDGIHALAGHKGSELGTGGMATKIHAADIATREGIPTYVINGTPPDNLYKLIDGVAIGTKFEAVKQHA